MRPASPASTAAMTLLVIVVAIAADLLLLGPLFQALFLQANGLSFWTGLAMLCVPKLIVYALLAYLCVRILATYGPWPGWAFVICFGAYWLAWRWGHNWPGPGWTGQLFTYAPLLAAPVGLLIGALCGGWGRYRLRDRL